MSKLYPPILDGTIPAFYEKGDGGVDITIPFTMNRTVGENQIAGFSLIFKSVANNRLLATFRADAEKWIKTPNQITFSIPGESYIETDIVKEQYKKNNYYILSNGKYILSSGDWDANTTYYIYYKWNANNRFRVGQYYKVQLAYVGYDGVVGHYSSVATIKFTGLPRVYIDVGDDSSGKILTKQETYTGVYQAPANDPLEKAYKYRFDVLDKNRNIYLTSGELLHNNYEDTEFNESRDVFTFNQSLPENEIFYIQYTVTTINQLTVTSLSESIAELETIEPEANLEVRALLNSENGYVGIKLIGKEDDFGREPAVIGSFILRRSCGKDNYQIWETIYKFQMSGELPSAWDWKDFTVEQGYSYKYALQQYSEYLVSNRIESNVVKVDFEDSFLYDGEKQLRIQFNPKITSFKNTLLEKKMDTIGSKYPYFFRNGVVSYKEFPISGLISCLTDKEELFLTNEEILKEEQENSLSGECITSERIFKMKVLDWLNDGNPKLFRSPTEGNFIVRLTNISLTPNDTLGRMLHTFQATAYEVCDFTYDVLVEKGFLHVSSVEEKYTTRWENVQFNGAATGTNLIKHDKATSLLVQDVIPGDKIQIHILGTPDNAMVEIEIGATGMYKIDLEDSIEIDVLKIATPISRGSFLYSYSSTAQNVFDTIVAASVSPWTFRQFIGTHSNIIDDIEEVFDYEKNGAFIKISGLRTSLLRFSYLRFTKREVYDVYCSTNPEFVYADKDDTSNSGKLTLEQYTTLRKKYRGLYEQVSDGSFIPSIQWTSEKTIYYKRTMGKYYWDDLYTNPIVDDAFKDVYLYKVHYPNGSFEYLDRRADKDDVWSDKCSFQIILDKNGFSTIDITETGEYEIPGNVPIQALEITNGIICETAYLTKTITYNIETEGSKSNYLDMRNAKNEFLIAEARYLGILSASVTFRYRWLGDERTVDYDFSYWTPDGDMGEGGEQIPVETFFNTIKEYKEDYESKKLKYLRLLYEALEEEKEASGLYV